MIVVKNSVILLVVAVLAGCSSSIPVRKESASLNLQYTIEKKGGMVDEVIAIMEPTFSAPNNVKGNNGVSFYNNFATRYKQKLAKALSTGFWELFSAKGFKTKGPFTDFDGLPYLEKKSIYLASIPYVDINFVKESVSKKCGTGYCWEEGYLNVTGEFTYKIIEPLTGQIFLTRRVSLSGLNPRKAYTRQWAANTSGGKSFGLIGSAIGAAYEATKKKPTELIDNTDKVLGEVISDFYQQAMKKLDAYISKEELLSYKEDVMKLKGLKRF
ncbi:MAG: HpaA family protein [Gammaproteobacteria bacterium]